MDTKNTRSIFLLHGIAILLKVSINACEVSTSPAVEDTNTVAEKEVDSEPNSAIQLEGWGEESHSNEVEPNYEVVFPEDKVNQITITIVQVDWDSIGNLMPPKLHKGNLDD